MFVRRRCLGTRPLGVDDGHRLLLTRPVTPPVRIDTLRQRDRPRYAPCYYLRRRRLARTRVCFARLDDLFSGGGSFLDGLKNLLDVVFEIFHAFLNGWELCFDASGRFRLTHRPPQAIQWHRLVDAGRLQRGNTIQQRQLNHAGPRFRLISRQEITYRSIRQQSSLGVFKPDSAVRVFIVERHCETADGVLR